MSLRQYLVIAVMLIISMVSGLTIWSSHRESQHEVQELFDAQLARSARLMLSLALTEINQGNLQALQDMILHNRLRLEEHKFDDEEEALADGHAYERKLVFQIWDGHGNMVLRSANAPLYPMTLIDSGYSDKSFEDNQWRVFSLWNYDHSYQVMAAERGDVRDELIDSIIQRLLLPFLVALPVLAWLVWMAVGWGLIPLKRVAEEVKNRHINYLEQLETGEVPEEVRPLVDELNRLFITLNASVEKERRFTSDAAHELRTPLAALKTHAQLAVAAEDGLQAKQSIEQILVGVDRASHVVDQLLALARVEHAGQDRRMVLQPVDLHQLSVVVVSDLVALAVENGVELSVQESAEFVVRGDVTGLSMLIRNLVDNAIRYTPAGSEVRLEFSILDGRPVLHVIDNGPGIPDPVEREKMFERFRRGEGLPQTGCGIGLSIVRSIADSHGAEVRLLPVEPQGLHVEVVFPVVDLV